jgi:hypothetical protein
MSQAADVPHLIIPLPGGRVARVPVDALEQYVSADARPAHDSNSCNCEVEAQEMSPDAQTGAMHWHTDWEMGHCTYNDDAGFPQTAYCWHRHPLGNSYTEIMQ